MIDLYQIKNKHSLVLMDNGYGMSAEKLHRMMGFGHSDKTSEVVDGRRAIGRYGNGFKSGTMRIGKDTLVLTRCGDSQSAGLLSQSFLQDINAEDVFIPLLSWDLDGKLLNKDAVQVAEGLEAIRKYSIFDSEEEILDELDALEGTGTIIIISNLRKVGDQLELQVNKEENDITIAAFAENETYQQMRTGQASSTKVPLDYSFRAYAAVLYKIPRMQIFLKGQKVHSKRISGLLTERMADSYRPHLEIPAKYEFGFHTESQDLYGVMMYHNNRLIKPYVRVGMQLEPNDKGVGVLGVVDADFLKPTHNKQDFDDTKEYRGLIRKMADTLQVYWWDKVVSKECKETDKISRPKRKKIPDVLWVQCEYPKCLKWRTLPAGTDMSKLPKIWYCKYHPNPAISESNHKYPEETWEDHTELEQKTRKRKKEFQAQKSKAKERRMVADEEKRLEAMKVLLSTQPQVKTSPGSSPQKMASLSSLLPNGGRVVIEPTAAHPAGLPELPHTQAEAEAAPTVHTATTTTADAPPLVANTDAERTVDVEGGRESEPVQSQSNETEVIEEEEPTKSGRQSQGQSQAHLSPLNDITASPNFNIPQGGQVDSNVAEKECLKLGDEIHKMLGDAEGRGMTGGLDVSDMHDIALRRGVQFSLVMQRYPMTWMRNQADEKKLHAVIESICHVSPNIVKVSPGFYALKKADSSDQGLGTNGDGARPVRPSPNTIPIASRTVANDGMPASASAPASVPKVDLQKHSMDLAMMLVHQSMGKSYNQNTTTKTNKDAEQPNHGANVQHKDLAVNHLPTRVVQDGRPPASSQQHNIQQNSSPAAATATNGAIMPIMPKNAQSNGGHGLSPGALFDASPSDLTTVEGKLKLSLLKLKDCLNCLYVLSRKKKNLEEENSEMSSHFKNALSGEGHNLVNINVANYCKALGLDVNLS
jgi:hypothetical protein